jgi:hypothetical protein
LASLLLRPTLLNKTSDKSAFVNVIILILKT